MAAMLKKAKKLEYPENPWWFSWKAWPNKYRLYNETKVYMEIYITVETCV